MSLLLQFALGMVQPMLQREPGDGTYRDAVVGGERFDSPNGGRLELSTAREN